MVSRPLVSEGMWPSPGLCTLGNDRPGYPAIDEIISWAGASLGELLFEGADGKPTRGSAVEKSSVICAQVKFCQLQCLRDRVLWTCQHATSGC